jgi:hypothetical protein
VTATAVSPVHEKALSGLDLGLSMLITHAYGEPRFEWSDAINDWRRSTDKRTGEPATYGAKVPCGRWEERQETAATPDELTKHVRHREYGLKRGVAIVCGFADVEMFEADDLETWDRFVTAVGADPVADAILARVRRGYEERARGGVRTCSGNAPT